jgi:hypothetical protein
MYLPPTLTKGGVLFREEWLMPVHEGRVSIIFRDTIYLMVFPYNYLYGKLSKS